MLSANSIENENALMSKISQMNLQLKIEQHMYQNPFYLPNHKTSKGGQYLVSTQRQFSIKFGVVDSLLINNIGVVQPLLVSKMVDNIKFQVGIKFSAFLGKK